MGVVVPEKSQISPLFLVYSSILINVSVGSVAEADTIVSGLNVVLGGTVVS